MFNWRAFVRISSLFAPLTAATITVLTLGWLAGAEKGHCRRLPRTVHQGAGPGWLAQNRLPLGFLALAFRRQDGRHRETWLIDLSRQGNHLGHQHSRRKTHPLYHLARHHRAALRRSALV